MGLDTLNQNIFGLTALLVSLVALVTTVLQVLQQYFSSADGYRRCTKSVMGEWADGTHRKLRASQFRVEVVFETPVIFLAPPENERGPIIGRKIHYMDGTPDSYKQTKVLQPQDQLRADEAATARVQTADDERASWVTLLSALQREERDSREWDEAQRNHSPPNANYTIPERPKYRLAVALQSKTRSWDFMPSSITRPYATSAVCHLVEMMAMLGMYWKVFDQTSWNMTAEGNGYILTSTIVHGLGVMVVFSTTGPSKFTRNRVIPTKKIKDLSFGFVPNIFEYKRDAQSLELLFGTKEEVSTTLESLGCQADMLSKYAKDHKHIFSVSFEIIGMLGKVLRLRGSSFRMVPNPTSDQWGKFIGNKPSWTVASLMKVFHAKVTELVDAEAFGSDHKIKHLLDHMEKISNLDCDDEAKLSVQCRETIHDSLDDVDKYLLSLKQALVLNVLVAHLTNVVDVLDDANSALNTIVLAEKEKSLIEYYFYHVRLTVMGNLDSDNKPLTKQKKDQRNTIWISLMFRMLCWFLLHDFDKADVKIVPSDLKGSRMPIFIG